MKIRQRRYRNGNVGWQLDVHLRDGQRLQRSFKTKKEAEEEGRRFEEERHKFGAVATAMSHAERLQYAEAKAKLAEAGVSLEQAVTWALAQAPVRQRGAELEAMWLAFIREKEGLNKRPRYLDQLRVSIGSFVRGRERVPAAEIPREIVKAWLRGNGWAPKTQKNYWGDLSTLFNWGKREGYVLENPCKGIEIAAVEEKEIAVFAPEQCRELLMTALNHEGRRFVKRGAFYEAAFVFRPLLGFAALATFAGVRPEEIKRSPRSVIDLEHRTIVVTAGRAKTRSRRVVELSKNLCAWLKLWMELCPDETMIIPKNFRMRWEELRETAKLKPPGWRSKGEVNGDVAVEPWPPDVLRHTFATMHLAAHGSIALVQSMMGHSKDEDTLFKAYRAVRLPDGRAVSKTLAKEFWGIVPPT